jgi:plastocyanin
LTPFSRAAGDFRVMMLDSAPDNAQHTNGFTPDILHVVTFIPTNLGHNTASKRGSLPGTAESWNRPMNEEFSITFTAERVSGFVCALHSENGIP